MASPTLAIVVTRAVASYDAPPARGRLLLTALLTTSEAGPSFAADVLAGKVSLTYRDGSQLRVPIPISGCRIGITGETLSCRSGDGRVAVNFVPMKKGAFAYRVKVTLQDLSSLGSPPPAGTPRAPLVLEVNHSAGSRRMGALATCRARGDSKLVCRGSGHLPSIVLVVTDDQRWDTLGAMPRLTSLVAREGVTFENAFVPTPICCPSRASLLTGQYAHGTGVLTNSPPLGGAPAFAGRDASTLATWLQGAGYRTALVGKYLNVYRQLCPARGTECYTPPGWDEWHAFIRQRYYDYWIAENGKPRHYGSADGDYSTDVLRDKAVDFIRSSRGPFFLYFAPHAPHREGVFFPLPATRHAGMFEGMSSWRPRSYDESDILHKPAWVEHLPRADSIVGSGRTFGWFTDLVREMQLESLQAVDEAIAALFAAVEAAGRLDDTIFIFLSDNGFGWGEHRVFGGKQCPYEECIRVPFLIRYSRAFRDERGESSMALNIDVAPTIAELAGVSPSTPVDGRSLAPLLFGQPVSWRDEFLLEYWAEETLAAPPSYTGVRTERWKYVEYEETGESELYDLLHDSAELHNRASASEYASIRTALQARLAEIRAAPRAMDSNPSR
jgi:N-acetylglucosamine-6-sulfatase